MFFIQFYILCENFSKIGPIIKKIPKFWDDPLKFVTLNHFFILYVIHHWFLFAFSVDNYSKCTFPSWVTQHRHWHALDQGASYIVSHANTTLSLTHSHSTSPVISKTAKGNDLRDKSAGGAFENHRQGHQASGISDLYRYAQSKDRSYNSGQSGYNQHGQGRYRTRSNDMGYGSRSVYSGGGGVRYNMEKEENCKYMIMSLSTFSFIYIKIVTIIYTISSKSNCNDFRHHHSRIIMNYKHVHNIFKWWIMTTCMLTYLLCSNTMKSCLYRCSFQ